MVREKLEWDDGQDWADVVRDGRDGDYVIGDLGQVVRAFARGDGDVSVDGKSG